MPARSVVLRGSHTISHDAFNVAITPGSTVAASPEPPSNRSGSAKHESGEGEIPEQALADLAKKLQPLRGDWNK